MGVLTATGIGSIQNTANVAVYNTTTHGSGPIAASAAGEVILAVVSASRTSGTVPTPTLINHSAMPFTLLGATVGTNPTTSGVDILGIWGCLATGTTSDDVDVDFAGVALTGLNASFFRVTGFDSPPVAIANIVDQLEIATFASNVSASLTLDAFANPNDIYIFGVGALAIPAAENITPEGSATGIHDLGFGSPNRGQRTSYKANDTSPSVTWTTASAGIALALVVDSTGGGAGAVVAQISQAGLTVPDVPSATRYVSLAGAGTQDGSSLANAAPISAIDAQIALSTIAGSGAEIILATGTYSGGVMNSPIILNNGGTLANPVLIRGQAPTGTILRSNRADPWSIGLNDGNPLFRLHAGHLHFADLHFENIGNGALHVWEVVTIDDISLVDWTADNVQRVVEVAGTVNGFTISDGSVPNYSKGFARFAGDSNDIHISNVTGAGVVGDAIPFGLQFTGTCHDFHVTDVHLHDHYFDGAPYWNGDGFVTEEETYDGHWTNCSSNGNTDAAFDLKGGTTEYPHVLINCSGDDNKRTFRLWRRARLVNCIGTNPHKRGGTGTTVNVHGTQSCVISVEGGSFTGGDPDTIVFQLEAGPGLMMVSADTVYEVPVGGELEREGTGSQIIFLTGPPTAEISRAWLSVPNPAGIGYDPGGSDAVRHPPRPVRR